MTRTTPFHPRLSELNSSGLYTHWQGYLSALRYGDSAKHEYFAIRNSAGFFDTSPLFKYAVTGADADAFLSRLLARDIRRCSPGKAHYTVWCDDRGHVLEDGVVFRRSAEEFLITAARPNLGYFSEVASSYVDVTIADVSDDFGVLAVQGPNSRQILAKLAPEVNGLAYFDHSPTQIAGAHVMISRTGFTGDLGFELTVPTQSAVAVLDEVIAAGEGHGLRPFGEDALLMARIEAGLSLIGVEFDSARLAETDHERFTPHELGFGWMLKDVLTTDRRFIGRDAIRREVSDQTSRWATVGVRIDPAAYHALYFNAGLVTKLDPTPLPWESMLYDDAGSRIGYATSLMYSPMLQQHVGIARVQPAFAKVGTSVHIEQTVHHEYTSVAATITRLPHFNPSRKTS